MDVQRLGGRRALAALALSSPLSFLPPAVCSYFVQQTVEITLELCATCGPEMNECTFGQLLALALELLCCCSRAEQFSELTPYIPSLLALLLRLCRASPTAAHLLRRPSTPASRCSLQRLVSVVCLAGHYASG